MSSSSNDIFGVSPLSVAVPPGGSLAIYVEGLERQTSVLVKYFSGGTLEIHQALLGTTMAGASLNALQGTGYIFGTSEAVSVDGPARFYLMATGSTAVAKLLRGLTTPGFSSLGNA